MPYLSYMIMKSIDALSVVVLILGWWVAWMGMDIVAQALNERSLRNYITIARRADRAGNPA